MRLLISSDNCILEFSDAETIDSLLDDAVVDLLSSGGKEECIKIISSSSSSLFSFGETVSLIHRREIN